MVGMIRDDPLEVVKFLVLIRIRMWICDQFFTYLNIGRWAFNTIYYHSPGGDRPAALEDMAFYTIYAQSAQLDTAAALAEFAL